MEALVADYRDILRSINRSTHWFDDGRYSGVFLPMPSEAWHTARKRIMLVGRETAGWNTNNGEKRIQNIIEKNENGDTAANANCFRIAHPRALHVHAQYRDQVIRTLKNLPDQR